MITMAIAPKKPSLLLLIMAKCIPLDGDCSLPEAYHRNAKFYTICLSADYPSQLHIQNPSFDPGVAAWAASKNRNTAVYMIYFLCGTMTHQHTTRPGPSINISGISPASARWHMVFPTLIKPLLRRGGIRKALNVGSLLGLKRSVIIPRVCEGLSVFKCLH